MSGNSELMARFARLGPVREEGPARSDSEPLILHHLERIGPFAHRIRVVHRLREAGLSLKAGHTAITELAEFDHTVCALPEDTDLDRLADDLRTLDVRLRRSKARPGAADYLREVRARHGLTLMDLAVRVGVPLNLLKSWEAGETRPDPAILNLVRVFDRNPRIVEDAIFEPL